MKYKAMKFRITNMEMEAAVKFTCIMSTFFCHPPYPPEFNYLCGLFIQM